MTRILSAAILLPIAILAVIYATPLYFLAGVGLIGTICIHEYFGLIRNMGIKARPLFGYAAFWILLIAFRQNKYPIIVPLMLVLLGAFLSAMWRYHLPIRERAMALMAEVLGIFYFSLFLYPAIQIRYAFGNTVGLHWTLILLATIWAGDSAALAVGKKIGKTRFAAALSPKKTNEGALGGLIAGVIVAVAFQRFLFTDLPMIHVIIASILVGIFGQLGDLAESMLKRAAEIKDSSQLIPGHGGALDRMDSLLFTFPVLYCYLTFIYHL
jgi:phosphatidate cytidylyltransferase